MSGERPGAWVGGRLFDAVHRHHLVYNQCWEDPAVDRRPSPRPEDRVLVITSAGCNALDYALTGARVLAVDVNPRQNHLLELKRAGIRALDFEDFFQLFGQRRRRAHAGVYAALRPELAATARASSGTARSASSSRAAPADAASTTAARSGLVAHVLRLLHGPRVRHLRRCVERLRGRRSIDEQLDIYRERDTGQLRGERLLSSWAAPGVLSLLGVPDPQRQMVHASAGGFAGFLRGCLDHVMSVALLRENYFWAVYLDGRLRAASCPEYLKEDEFARLKAGLVDRVSTFTGTVTECLGVEREPFTAFVLLDHMDWLARQPRRLEEEWDRIFSSAAAGARVIFRSGSPDARFLPAAVRARLRFDAERAAWLHRQDRVGTYASFHIAEPLPA